MPSAMRPAKTPRTSGRKDARKEPKSCKTPRPAVDAVVVEKPSSAEAAKGRASASMPRAPVTIALILFVMCMWFGFLIDDCAYWLATGVFDHVISIRVLVHLSTELSTGRISTIPTESKRSKSLSKVSGHPGQ